NNIVYESGYMYPSKFRPLSVGNTFIIRYNVSVYNDILGQVAYSASGSKTNGNSNWFKDITISNLKLNDAIDVTLTGSNLNFSNDLLNCQLIYSYATTGSPETRLLATFNGYNSSTNKVSLISTGNDLLSLFKDNPYGDLYLKFSFSQNAATDNYANLTYTVAFSYNYSYTEMSSSK
ncbi:MAG TPA: hypothetical protein PKN22_10770, partial [Taishania sp.]|nr:hypothetical protein [Taishania sp.]